MVSSTTTTAEEYLATLPEDRREAVAVVRQVVLENLPDSFVEGMSHGMLGWYLPLERFGDTYNGEPLGLAGIASQKNYISLYLNTVYSDPIEEAWFQKRYAASGKRLNMGKSCLRFRRLEELALDVIGETIRRVDVESFIAHYEAARGSSRRTRAATVGGKP